VRSVMRTSAHSSMHGQLVSSLKSSTLPYDSKDRLQLQRTSDAGGPRVVESTAQRCDSKFDRGITSDNINVVLGSSVVICCNTNIVSEVVTSLRSCCTPLLEIKRTRQIKLFRSFEYRAWASDSRFSIEFANVISLSNQSSTRCSTSVHCLAPTTTWDVEGSECVVIDHSRNTLLRVDYFRDLRFFSSLQLLVRACCRARNELNVLMHHQSRKDFM
jgi:hypothetical protein